MYGARWPPTSGIILGSEQALGRFTRKNCKVNRCGNVGGFAEKGRLLDYRFYPVLRVYKK
jgi:hypothetical protein